MAKYGKFFTAILGAVITGVAVFAGVDLEAKGLSADSVMSMLVPILTAVGVWAVPNKPE